MNWEAFQALSAMLVVLLPILASAFTAGGVELFRGEVLEELFRGAEC